MSGIDDDVIRKRGLFDLRDVPIFYGKAKYDVHKFGAMEGFKSVNMLAHGTHPVYPQAMPGRPTVDGFIEQSIGDVAASLFSTQPCGVIETDSRASSRKMGQNAGWRQEKPKFPQE